MKLANILLIAITLVFLISFVSAETYIFKSGTIVSIPQQCTINQVPQSTANANLTISKIGSSPLVTNQVMTSQGDGSFIYNYTFQDNGLYELDGTCCVGATCWSPESNIYAEVTPNGSKPDSAQGTIFFVLIVLAIIFMVVFFLVGYNNDANNEYDNGFIKVNYKKYLRYFMYFLSYLMLVFVVFLAQEASKNFLWFSSLYGFFHMMWIMALIGLIIYGLIGLPLLLMSLIADKKFTDMLQRGLKLR
jgi:hypothetical protein